MNYKDVSVIDLCWFLIGRGEPLKFFGWNDWKEFSKSEMYDFIKEKTDNFDIVKFKYFMQDLREFDMPFLITREDGKKEESTSVMSFYNLAKHEHENESITERIIGAQLEWEGSETLHLTNLLVDFSEIAETEYKRVKWENSTLNKSLEQWQAKSFNNFPVITPAPADPILSELKRPNNTHGQQFALLEITGIIDFLKSKYNLPDTKMSELIANIMNKDIQNTRIMLSMTNTGNSESKKDRNKKVVDPILIRTGAFETGK